jgi:membrane protein YqaA with SNARE-associated domain
MPDELISLLIPAIGAFLGGIMSYFVAPWFQIVVQARIQDKKQRESIQRERQITSIDSIYAWVCEHLTASVSTFYKASEQRPQWETATYRYEESDAMFSHVLALARRLKVLNRLNKT